LQLERWGSSHGALGRGWLLVGWLSASHSSSLTALSSSGSPFQQPNTSTPTDECAGVDTSCLNADLKASQAGSVCKPLADGAKCMGGTCSKGVCGGG